MMYDIRYDCPHYREGEIFMLRLHLFVMFSTHEHLGEIRHQEDEHDEKEEGDPRHPQRPGWGAIIVRTLMFATKRREAAFVQEKALKKVVKRS